MKLHAEQYGSGQPVLLIHGFGGSTYSWRHLIEPLSDHRQVIAIDLKGFGGSPKPRDDAYSIYDQARLVREYIVGHDLRDVVLVGHSYGGGVAIVAALQLLREQPARVSQLVLIDAVAYRQNFPQFIKLLRMPIVGELAVHLLHPHRQAKHVLEIGYHRDERITPDQIAAHAVPIRSPGGRKALLKVARQIVPPDMDALIQRYKTIEIPTLLIWGQHDVVVPLTSGRRLNREIRGSQLLVIEDCGHIPHEERPEKVIEPLLSFLLQNGEVRYCQKLCSVE